MNKKFVFWFIFTCLFGGLIYALRGILLPFILGFILAYILNPLTIRLEKKVCSRSVASGSIVVGLIITILSSLLIIFPILQSQIIGFIQKVPSYVSTLWNKILPFLDMAKGYTSPEQMDVFKETISSQAFSFFNKIGVVLLDLFGESMVLFNIVSFILITPIITFYLLNDWPTIVKKIKGFIPQHKINIVQDHLTQIDIILSAFIRGQVIVCLFLALFYGLGLTVIGLDLGFSVGFIAGILSFIPYVGSITGFILSLLLAFNQSAGWSLFVGVLLVFGIGQFIEGYILTPKLVGDKVGLHPAWVIFALFAGGYLFGFLGVLLAVPVSAVFGVLLRSGLQWYKKSAFYKGHS